mgnify:CR=1 FL=1
MNLQAAKILEKLNIYIECMIPWKRFTAIIAQVEVLRKRRINKVETNRSFTSRKVVSYVFYAITELPYGISPGVMASKFRLAKEGIPAFEKSQKKVCDE